MSKAYFDVQLLQREFFNKNKFVVKFTRMREHETYVQTAGKSLGPEFAYLKPDEFLYLPHGYYIIEGVGVPQGEPIDLLMNLEKNMFKGIKVPSNVYGLGE